MNRKNLADVNWKIFIINEIFEIKKVYGKPIEAYKKGRTLYISTSSSNNGVIDFVDSPKEDVSAGNTISIDPIGGKAFYHKRKFVGRGYSGASINLLYNENLNEHNSLFIIGCIEKSSKEKASYGCLFNSNRLASGRVLMPSTEDGAPDWQFMEDYVKQERQKQVDKVVEYYRSKAIEIPKEMNSDTFKEFWLDDIVNIKSGVRLTKATQEKGKRPFIGATDSNNGITNFVENTNKSLDMNILGVNYNGSVVENFYHPYEAIFSDDVKRLEFKDLKFRNKYCYLFLKQIIIMQKKKYTYGYKFNANRMKRQKVILPINSEGEIDYIFMENKMKTLEQESISRVINYFENQ